MNRCAILICVVVVVVASLEGGQEHTIEVDKLLHFGGYATLAVIFVLGLRPALFVPALILLGIMGVAIEFIQPLNSRSFEWGDAAANTVGLVVGGTLGILMRVILRYARTKMQMAKFQKRRRTFQRGALILQEGAPVRRFCLIDRGEVELSREVDGQRQVLGTMGQGEVFGLLGVIQSQPQYATVEAMTETTLYSLELEDLVESSNEPTEPIAAVLAVMAKHLHELADRVITAEKPAK